jgi:hypothetical protein
MTLPILASTLAKTLEASLAQAASAGIRAEMEALLNLVVMLGNLEARLLSSVIAPREVLVTFDLIASSAGAGDVRTVLAAARQSLLRRCATGRSRNPELVAAALVSELQAAQVAVALLAARGF